MNTYASSNLINLIIEIIPVLSSVIMISSILKLAQAPTGVRTTMRPGRYVQWCLALYGSSANDHAFAPSRIYNISWMHVYHLNGNVRG